LFDCKCDICKGSKYYEVVDRETNESIYHKTSCYKKYQELNDLRYQLYLSNISDFLLDYTLDKYVGKDEDNNLKKVKLFIDKFDEKFCKQWLYFWSTEYGTQKTTIASYIGLELLKKNKKVNFILMNNLINLLKDVDYIKDDIEKENTQYKIQKLKDSDLLIIDESFDKRSVTIYQSGYQLAFLDTFLKEREQLGKAIIFTSNIYWEEIDTKIFSDKIKGQLSRKCIYSSLLFKDNISILLNDFNPDELWQ